MKNLVADGKSIKITGQTTGHSGGDLLIYNSWPGVVIKDIIGTSEQETTIDGKPVTGQYGDGEGDLLIEGVIRMVDENPTALGAGVIVSRNSASGVVADTSSDRMGHVVTARYQDGGVDYVDVKLPGRPF